MSVKRWDRQPSPRVTDARRHGSFWDRNCSGRIAAMFAKRISSSAQFAPDKMGKSTLMRGDLLFVGVNAFEPGQEHAPHVHEGQDKLYVILEGTGVVHIGEQAEILSAGDAAYAPSGVAHSIRNPGPARLVTMVVLAPPPQK